MANIFYFSFRPLFVEICKLVKMCHSKKQKNQSCSCMCSLNNSRNSNSMLGWSDDFCVCSFLFDLLKIFRFGVKEPRPSDAKTRLEMGFEKNPNAIRISFLPITSLARNY